MSRTASVTYGSLVIGASGTDSNIRLTGKVAMEQSYRALTVEFDVIVLGSSAANFLASEATLVAAYTKPLQDLSVIIGGSARWTFSHSSNTGFNAQPSIEKVAGIEDTDRSSRYRLSVAVQLPADLTGKAGRQDSRVELSTGPNGKKMVGISGTYTAVGGNSARDQYTANIATYVGAVKSAVGISNWELTDIPSEDTDDEDKILTFRRQYAQIIKAQGVGTTDVGSIKNPQLVIRKVEKAANDPNLFGLVTPLVEYRVSYSCDVDWTVTTDLAALYSGTIRPLIIQEIESLSSGSVYVLTDTFVPEPYGSRVAVSMSALADGDGDLISAAAQTEDVRSTGEIRYVIWDGNPYSRDVYQGPKTHLKRVRRSVRRLAGSTAGDDFGQAPDGFRLNSTVRKVSSESIGLASASQLDVERVTSSEEFERVDFDIFAKVAQEVAEAAEKAADFLGGFLKF